MMSPKSLKNSSGIKQALVTGNMASAEGALAVGCRFFAGYPITPSSEIAHHMSRRLPQSRSFLCWREINDCDIRSGIITYG